MRAADGGLAAWRFASRLARREVRRRPGRTLLVTILVALPVLAMTIGSVMARTGGVDTTLRAWRQGTDLVIESWGGPAPDVVSALPREATTTSVVQAQWVPIETDSGRFIDSVMIVGRSDGQSGDHVLAVSAGRAPAEGEVWLSSSLADQLDARVGDEVSLSHPRGTWTVSGIGRSNDDFDRRIAVLGRLPAGQFRSENLQFTTLVDLPGEPSPADVDRVGRALDQATAATRTDGGVDARWPDRPAFGDGGGYAGLAWGWVGGAIALAATGIIIAAAFATSARRQLVTIGQLSANGASQNVTRRMLALQGFWTGAAGSVGGLAVGLALLLVGRSAIERVVGYTLAPYVFSVPDFVVIGVTGVAAATIAALVPAKSATRIPVLSALAGRRPLGTVPARLVPIGLGLFGGGIFLLVVAAASRNGGNATVAAAVVGGLLVLAGACCVSPLAIDRMSRASAVVGRSWRFAGRSLGRTRTRSAAVVTAIAVTGALACAGSSVALRLGDETAQNERLWPSDAVVIRRVDVPVPAGPTKQATDLAPRPAGSVDAALQADVEAIVPSAEWHPIRTVSADHMFVVADQAMMDLYDLGAADRSALQATGVLSLMAVSEAPFDEGDVAVIVRTGNGEVELPVASREHVRRQREQPGRQIEFDGVHGEFPYMITEDAAHRAGFEIVTGGAFVRSDGSLTRTQQNALTDLFYGDGSSLGYHYRDVPLPGENSPWNVSFQMDPAPQRSALVQALIVGAALLITLLVVAIGLSLAATESRDERDVLVAVGARPATMRRMAGAKASVITLTGVVLAIPTGMVPIAAVMQTLEEPLYIPWLAIGALVFVLPVVAGLAAWGVSSIAQRARPVRMSNLAFE